MHGDKTKSGVHFMQRARIAFCVSLFLLALNARTLAQPADLPKSRAELTNYEETTRYEEVLNFIRCFAAHTEHHAGDERDPKQNPGKGGP